MDQTKEGLLTWLASDPLPDELLPLPWDLKITYMPIDVVRKKFSIMQAQFGATVEQVDVTVNALNTQDKDTMIWACVKFIIHHHAFPDNKLTICGTASFLRGQYQEGWAYAQICESLATTRAFSKHWKQFGRDLNKTLDNISEMKSPTGAIRSTAVVNTFKLNQQK